MTSYLWDTTLGDVPHCRLDKVKAGLYGKAKQVQRDQIATDDFISKLRTATADSRYQVSTDGFRPYVYAIDAGLSDRVDYSQVVKVYGKQEDGREARYSPGEVTEIKKTPVLGNPDMSRACTSHIERQNGSFRQWCKRLTRLRQPGLQIGLGASKI